MPLTLEKPAVLPRQPLAATFAPALRMSSHRQTPPPPRDSLHFGSHNQEKAIAEEAEQLRALEKPSFWIKTLKIKQFQCSEETLRQRAAFNVTGNRDLLNVYLPYRQKLSQTGDERLLKQYDALVDDILKNAQFLRPKTNKAGLEAAINGIYNTLFNQAGLPSRRSIWRQLKRVLLFPVRVAKQLYHKVNRKARNTDLMRGIPPLLTLVNLVRPQAVERALTPLTEPYREKSTRYIVAGQIAELLHQRPDYAQSIVQDNRQRPLRFVLMEDHASAEEGAYKPGIHLITLKRSSLWSEAGRKTGAVAQHEFVHAMSEPANLETLPPMNGRQKAAFLQARTELDKLFDRKYSGFLKWPFSFRSKKTLGLRAYAFHNHMEFLAVTLDTFKTKPEALKTTEPGRKLYNLYRELFGLDPANELPQQAPPPAEGAKPP